MIDFIVETEIDRPVDEVFAYVADPSRLATWQTNTVSAVTEDGGPMAAGARLREIHRMPGGRKLESVVEVAEFEPNRTLGLRVVEGTPIHGHISLEEAGGATLMRFRVYGQLEGAMRLLQPLVRRQLQRQFRADCNRLKSLLEGEGRS